MANHVETDISVQRFGFTGDESGQRLTFPHAEAKKIEGKSGATAYGAADCVFDKLEGRLDTLRWSADSASLGGAWLRDDAGRFDVSGVRFELPSGVLMTRADKGVEILSPHVSLSDLRIDVKGPFGRSAPAAPAAEPKELRQTKLRFLDSLSGHINLTIKVVLDLPVLGRRTLDQKLEVPITEGSLDFRALEDSLDWLEGRFIDIDASDGRLAVRWKVPIFGASHDLISFTLDQDAAALVTFGRVPVRSLLDFRIGSGGKSDGKKSKVLESVSIDAIDIALSLLAPRSVETSTGLIMFGGDDEPGMVDLQVTGEVKDAGAGKLDGRITSIDVTFKDVAIGPASITADRLNFDGLDEFEVMFDGLSPAHVHMLVHRVIATNFDVRIGR
jgi:hypothetical protein